MRWLLKKSKLAAKKNKKRKMALNHIVAPATAKPWLPSFFQSVSILPGGALTMGTGSSIALPSQNVAVINDTLTGPWAAPQNCMVRLTKMPGGAVLFTLSMSAAVATLPTFITLTTPLPVGFRPSVSTTYLSIPIINNGVYAGGICQISTTGIVFILNQTAGPFAGLGITGTPSVVECVFRAADT